jgi:hypothetical protein
VRHFQFWVAIKPSAYRREAVLSICITFKDRADVEKVGEERLRRPTELIGMLQGIGVYEQPMDFEKTWVRKVSRQQRIEMGATGFTPADELPATFARLGLHKPVYTVKWGLALFVPFLYS